MSSLAAARADNFYHPPDWDPRKQSRAEYAEGPGGPKWKAHPLRERAKKLDQGILTIRFEMPFNVRCTGCNNQIAKGVRFNAEKKTIGKYLSTKILSFRMLCHCEDGSWRTCQRRNPHFIEVHTDPKNAEYVVAEGAVRVDSMSLLSTEELGVERTLDEDEAAKRSANPFYKLETAGPAAKRKPWLSRLQEKRDEDWEDDFEANRALRRTHRTHRKQDLVEAATRESQGIRVPLLSEHPADIAAAHAVRFEADMRRSAAAREQPKMRLLGGSIFGGAYERPKPSKRARVTKPSDAPTAGGVARAAAAAERVVAGGRQTVEQRTEEEERLRALQLRRERDMRITMGVPLGGATLDLVGPHPRPAPPAAEPTGAADADADADVHADADADAGADSSRDDMARGARARGAVLSRSNRPGLPVVAVVPTVAPPAVLPAVTSTTVGGHKRSHGLVAYSDSDSEEQDDGDDVHQP